MGFNSGLKGLIRVLLCLLPFQVSGRGGGGGFTHTLGTTFNKKYRQTPSLVWKASKWFFFFLRLISAAPSFIAQYFYNTNDYFFEMII